VWLTTETEVTSDLNDAFTRMKGLGQAYGVVGNHDTSPVNSFPPAAVDTFMSSQWAYDVLSSEWASWIGSDAATQADANFGSYSVLTAAGLRLISINTNFWYKQNFWLFEKTMERDPSGQLAWLAAELEAAEVAGERAWVMGHMPLGSSDAFHDQSEYFDQIIQRFDATIAALFFGHTHQDEFQLSYSTPATPSASTAVMTSYIAPALTPISGNPTFRVYTVDPLTFAVLDYAVFYANLSSPTYQAGPVWEQLYSVKDAYGSLLGITDPAAELTPAFWHNLTELFESDDAVFQAWQGRKSRGVDLTPCTGTCKSSTICGLRAAQSQYNCATVSPGINFKRVVDINTDSAATRPHDHPDTQCESSAIVPILSSFAGEAFPAFQAALGTRLGSVG